MKRRQWKRDFFCEAYERASENEELVRMNDEVASMKLSGSCAVSAVRPARGVAWGWVLAPDLLGSALERELDAERERERWR